MRLLECISTTLQNRLGVNCRLERIGMPPPAPSNPSGIRVRNWGELVRCTCHNYIRVSSLCSAHRDPHLSRGTPATRFIERNPAMHRKASSTHEKADSGLLNYRLRRHSEAYRR